jgi:MoxR-like ATPase
VQPPAPETKSLLSSSGSAKRSSGRKLSSSGWLIAVLADGHVLMEGLPGVAKTRSIKTLSKLIESQFRRVQFTPDLAARERCHGVGDLIARQTGHSKFQQGPIFGNLVLADEINRAPAKVQAALLEAMEERQVDCFRKDTQTARSLPGARHAKPD